MKKIILITTLFIIISPVFAFHPCQCDEGKTGPDTGQILQAIGSSALFMAIPLININYSMHEEDRDYLIFITDGIFVGSLAYIMIDKLINPSNEPWDNDKNWPLGKRILTGAGMLIFMYSLWDLVDGGSLKDSGRVSRAAWSMVLIPIGSIFSMFSLDVLGCRPRVFGDNQFIYPVFGPDYAGLNCSIKF